MNKVKSFEVFFDTLSNIKRLLHQQSNEALDQRVITMFQLQALSILEKSSDMTPGKLSETLCVSSSSVAQLIDRLIVSGWVNRSHDEADRRVVHLELTSKGTLELAKLKKARQEHFAHLSKFISEEDLAQLVRIMIKFYGEVEKDMKGGQSSGKV